MKIIQGVRDFFGWGRLRKLLCCGGIRDDPGSKRNLFLNMIPSKHCDSASSKVFLAYLILISNANQ